MNKHALTKLSSATLSLALVTSFGFSSIANAFAKPIVTTTGTPAAVKAEIAKGDAAIASRQTTLNALEAYIGTLTKVKVNDKLTLSTQITAASGGLATLKGTLDKDTTLAAANVDSAKIYTGFRVYMLIAPKVTVVRNADDQQVAQAKLLTFYNELQSHQAAMSSSDKAKMLQMQHYMQVAGQLSSNVETKALPLLPSDYNTDHTLFVSYYANLKTAHSDDVNAQALGHSVKLDLDKLSGIGN